MYTFDGLKNLDDKNSSKAVEEEEKPQLIQELKKLIHICNEGDPGQSMSPGEKAEQETGELDKEKVKAETQKAETEFMKNVVTIIQGDGAPASDQKTGDSGGNNQVAGAAATQSMQSETQPVQSGCSGSVNSILLLDIITKLCNQENVDTLVECGLISECMHAVDVSRGLTPYVVRCIKLLDTVMPLHKETCCHLIGNHKQVVFKLAELYKQMVNYGDKALILNLFNAIVKHALTVDDYVFDCMLHTVCSAIDCVDDAVVLSCLTCMDNCIELYQEWDVNAKLYSMGVVNKLVSQLSHSNVDVVLKNLRCIGNLLSAESHDINLSVINGGVLNQFQAMLFHENKEVVIAAIWAISNVAAGPKGSTAYFFEFDIIPILIHYIKCKDGKTALESLWALANLFEDATSEQRRIMLYDQDLMACYAECLSSTKQDMQSEITEGYVYLELLRDTFKSIIRCVTTPKRERKKTKPSDSQSHHSDSEDDSSDDEPEEKRESFEFLCMEERVEVVKRLLELGVLEKLNVLSDGRMDSNDELKEVFHGMHYQFWGVVNEHDSKGYHGGVVEAGGTGVREGEAAMETSTAAEAESVSAGTQ